MRDGYTGFIRVFTPLGTPGRHRQEGGWQPYLHVVKGQW
jgi:hypothetical protein